MDRRTGGECTLCSKRVKHISWLCQECANKVGAENISNMIMSVPEYLGKHQYHEWLRLTLLNHLNENKNKNK